MSRVRINPKSGSRKVVNRELDVKVKVKMRSSTLITVSSSTMRYHHCQPFSSSSCTRRLRHGVLGQGWQIHQHNVGQCGQGTGDGGTGPGRHDGKPLSTKKFYDMLDQDSEKFDPSRLNSRVTTTTTSASGSNNKPSQTKDTNRKTPPRNHGESRIRCGGMVTAGRWWHGRVDRVAV